MSPWKMAAPLLLVSPTVYLVTVAILFWRAHNDAVTEGVTKPCA